MALHCHSIFTEVRHRRREGGPCWFHHLPANRSLVVKRATPARPYPERPVSRMELNLAPASASAIPLRLAREKPKTKGSWKKRRREEVLQRAREKRRQRGGGRTQHRSKALQTQADEFSSGIDKPADKANIEDFHEGPGQPDKRRRIKKGSVAFEELPNVVIEGAKSEQVARLKGREGSARKPSIQASVKRKQPDNSDQTPEAVSATLAVIGNTEPPRSLPRCEEGGVEDAQKPGSDAKSDKTDALNVHDETFGADSFEEIGLYRSIVHHMEKRMAIRTPTKIQERVLKALLNLDKGQQSVDVLVRSATGSGKTLAYLLPISHYLLNRTRRTTREDGSLAIVVVPTRELADQVHEVAQQLLRPWHWIVVGSVVGGENKKREKSRLRKGVNILVATPGRLLDHMRNTMSFLYGFCEFLVLDEADRLLDLGFEAEIREIVENLDNQAKVSNPGAGKTRSNILLSATLRNDVEKLAKFSLTEPVEISVEAAKDEKSDTFAMPTHLKQHFCIVEQRYRLVTLACFLRLRALKEVSGSEVSDEETALPTCKIIVFFSTCDSVDFHYDLFNNAKLPSELRKRHAPKDQSDPFLPLKIYRIHGNHSQTDRVESLRDFRRSHRAVLLCTDVAARGLDLKGLTFAIQYDPPTGGQGEELEYLHRAGRTARIGSRGDGLLFLLPSERAYIGKLESKGVSIAEISGSAALAALYPKADLSHQASISYATRLVTSAVQECFEALVKDDEDMKRKAVAGFQAYCRAYATHARDVRYFFHVRNLHLGHVARSFTLSDKPAEFSLMMAEIQKAKAETDASEVARKKDGTREAKRKADIVRAIAEGEQQPYNNQSTALAKRRREKGSGQEAFKEMAMEFGS